MNLFYLDHDPTQACKYHLDKHVVKMVIEYGQLLSSAHHVLNTSLKDKCMKLSHQNHPCAVFTRTSAENYDLVLAFYTACAKEYTHRYGRQHEAYTKYIDALRVNPVQATGATDVPLCMPDDCKVGDAVQSYREYYRKVKIPELGLRFTNRYDPDWV